MGAGPTRHEVRDIFFGMNGESLFLSRLPASGALALGLLLLRLAR
jgi:hypothetical protein